MGRNTARKTILEASTGAEKEYEGNLDEDACCLSVYLGPSTVDPCPHLNMGSPSKVSCAQLMAKECTCVHPSQT